MRHVVIAASLLLAACGGGGGSGNNQSDEAPVAQMQEQTPENLTDDPQNSAVPLNAAEAAAISGSPATLTTIPAAFQGRWGIGVADCDPSTGADKGKLTIAGNRLSFFESRGDATKITQPQPTRIAFDLPMTGEGMSWSDRTTLTLMDGGKTLVRQKTAPGEPPEVTRYVRCPA